MKTKKTQVLVQTAVLTAIILIMAFTPLGYLKTAGIEITFITIPVVIGAICLGPGVGAILGTVFGVTSFIQCFGMSPFGVALLGVSPIGTLITCIVPRTLMGFATGLIFRALHRRVKQPIIAFGAAGLAGPLLNTILFMSTLMLIFANSTFMQELNASMGGLPLIPFVLALVTINGLIEAAACFILSTLVARALWKFMPQE